jgi:hypothetical protein
MIFVILTSYQMLFVFVKCRVMRAGKGCGTYGRKRDTYSLLVGKREERNT